MRDIREKFGTEVKTFAYAFVLKNHPPGWDSAKPEHFLTPPPEPSPLALPTSKTPKYIEVKLRA